MERASLEAARASGRRDHEIKIVDRHLLGEGTYGEAYSARAVVEQEGKARSIPVVVKEYRPEKFAFAEQAAANYTLLKEAGLPVFPTFRLDAQHHQIVMTNGHSDTWVCLGTNRDTASVKDFPEYGKPCLAEQADVLGMARHLFDEAVKASRHGLVLQEDMIFFLLDKQDYTDIRYVFADLACLNNRRVSG